MKNSHFIMLLVTAITTLACASQTDVVTEHSTLQAQAHSPASILDNSDLSRVLNDTRYMGNGVKFNDFAKEYSREK